MEAEMGASGINHLEAKGEKPKRRRCWFLPSAEVLAERQREHDLREAAAIAEMDNAPLSWGLCYFIGCDEGMVKIGWSKDVNRRFNELRGPSIYKLEILATARGGRERERHYHRLFEADALGGEWFTLSPAILAEIARLQPTPSLASGPCAFGVAA